MKDQHTQILNAKEIDQKIVRIAYEIYENNYKEKSIVIVGVKKKGDEVAKRLVKTLKEISPIEVVHYSIEIHKDKPLDAMVIFSGELKSLKNKVVILVDDVLNSGRTLIYAAKYLLDANPKALRNATLIDRIHRKFPVHADYVGLTLSTNLREHITVELSKGKEAAYLE